MSRRRGLACAALCLAALSGVARAADAPVQVGPFTFGMSLDEARAAAPKLVWEEAERSAYSGRVLALAAADAVTLGGLPHKVTVRPGYHGGYELALEARPPVARAAACDAAVLAIAAEAEPWIGKLNGVDATAYQDPSPPRSGLRWESRRGPDGNLSVVPVPDYAFSSRPAPRGTVKVGKRSTLSLVTRLEGAKPGDEPDERVGEAEGHRSGLSVFVRSRFQRQDSGGHECKLRTVLRRLMQMPAPRQVDFATLKFIAGDTIGLRHHSLDGLPAPSQALEFELACAINRREGRLWCQPPRKQDADAYLAALLMRAGALRLEPGQIDPDDPAQLLTKFALALRPEDRRPLDFLERPRVAASMLRWQYQPTSDDIPAGNPQVEFAGERIEVVCQVQDDHSLVCTDRAGAAQTGETRSARAARHAIRLISRYIATPALADGQPSQGAVFSTVVEFGKAARR